MSSIVEPAIQDPDLAPTTCPKGESEGYREIIRACRHNPELFLEIISRGTMKYQADDDYEVKTKTNLSLQAGEDMVLETGGNLTLKVGGNLTLDVQGIIDEKATQHIAGKR